MKINASATVRLAKPAQLGHCAIMDLSTTLILLAAALAATVFAGWRGARPPDPWKGPRLIPWRFLMIGTAALALLLLVHLATLFGAARAPWIPGS